MEQTGRKKGRSVLAAFEQLNVNGEGSNCATLPTPSNAEQLAVPCDAQRRQRRPTFRRAGETQVRREVFTLVASLDDRALTVDPSAELLVRPGPWSPARSLRRT